MLTCMITDRGELGFGTVGAAGRRFHSVGRAGAASRSAGAVPGALLGRRLISRSRPARAYAVRFAGRRSEEPYNNAADHTEFPEVDAYNTGVAGLMASIDRNAKAQVKATIELMSSTQSHQVRQGRGPVVTVATCAIALAAIAGCARGPAVSAPAPATSSAAVSVEDASAAKSTLCTAMHVAARAVQDDSARGPLDGRIALLNGAGMLDDALSPALDADLASRAKRLVSAYRAAVVAAGASAAGTDDPRWTAAVQAVTDATAALRSACA